MAPADSVLRKSRTGAARYRAQAVRAVNGRVRTLGREAIGDNDPRRGARRPDIAGAGRARGCGGAREPGGSEAVARPGLRPVATGCRPPPARRPGTEPGRPATRA